MPGKRAPNLGVTAGWARGERGWHDAMNETLWMLDAVVQCTAASRRLGTPPAAPAEGERYLVPPNASGDWDGHGEKLAVWRDGAWRFIPTRHGWRVWIEDEVQHITLTPAGWRMTTGEDRAARDAAAHAASAAEAVARASWGKHEVIVADGDAEVEAEAMAGVAFLAVAGAVAQGRSVLLPAVPRRFAAHLDAASLWPVSLRRGAGTVFLHPGVSLDLHLDGTPDGLRRLSEGPLRLMAMAQGPAPVRLTRDGGTPTAANILALRDNSAQQVKAQVTVLSTDLAACAVWEWHCLARRGVGPSSVVVSSTPEQGQGGGAPGAPLLSSGSVAGWGCAVSADTVLGGVAVSVTVPAGVSAKAAASLFNTEAA